MSGGSRGLGLAIVTDLLAAGLKVAAFARTVTPELTALGEKYPDHLYYGSVDINDAEAGQAFVRTVESTLGPIDGLVNNAAIGQDSLHVHTSADKLADIIKTNLTSYLWSGCSCSTTPTSTARSWSSTAPPRSERRRRRTGAKLRPA